MSRRSNGSIWRGRLIIIQFAFFGKKIAGANPYRWGLFRSGNVEQSVEEVLRPKNGTILKPLRSTNLAEQCLC